MIDSYPQAYVASQWSALVSPYYAAMPGGGNAVIAPAPQTQQQQQQGGCAWWNVPCLAWEQLQKVGTQILLVIAGLILLAAGVWAVVRS